MDLLLVILLLMYSMAATSFNSHIHHLSSEVTWLQSHPDYEGQREFILPSMDAHAQNKSDLEALVSFIKAITSRGFKESYW